MYLYKQKLIEDDPFLKYTEYESCNYMYIYMALVNRQMLQVSKYIYIHKYGK